MPLQPGDRLGPYQIVGWLGEGGMGTVYRAHDPRLARDVAIKIVRAALGAESDWINRFEREARLLAALNHPHIATVHGLEESNGTRFLVMELVEGVTLSERLRDGPMPTREVLTLGLQIAGAMETAHDRNIIHRDLKPANIKLTPLGSIKVLDFGLAKALAVDPAARAISQSPTFTAADTGVGVVLGTAAYMSPEQARGRDVDRRTDIWAFACVLFDMFTGKPAFAGETISDTLAAILTRDPDWSLLPADLPPPIHRLLRRCLEKDPHRRLRDIGDARFEIEEALSTSADSGEANLPSAPSSPLRRPSSRLGTPGLLAAALAAGVLLGTVGFWFLNRAPDTTTRQAFRFTVTLADDQRLTGLDFQTLAISPTDAHVVYVASRRGHQQLFLRPLSSLDADPLNETDDALNPFFSPDGKWIAFFADGKLKKVPVGEGSVREIADADIGFGGVWAPDGTIIFAPSNASGLMRVSAEGGPVQPVTSLDAARGEFSHRWPALLPDGRTVLFAVGTVGNWDDAEIAMQGIDDGSRPRILLKGGTYPRLLPTGALVYAHAGAMHTVRLDPRQQQVIGSSVKVLADVMESADGAAQFAVSARGTMVYAPTAPGADGRTLVWVDRDGNTQPLAAPPRAYLTLRLSPDGRTLATGLGGTPEQIWTYSIAENQLTPFTHEGGSSPAWSPDGSRIFFSAARDGPAALFVQRMNGTTEQRLSRSDRSDLPQSASRDGALLFVRLNVDSGRDIWILPADGTARPLVATPASESAPAFSPDGEFLAFVSDEVGRPEVFLASVGNPLRHVQVSTTGGTEPVFRRDGTELFFRSGNRLMAASIRTRPALSAGSPRPLFEGEYENGVGGSPAYDVSNDGMRFLMIKRPAADRVGRELRITLGWTDELKE